MVGMGRFGALLAGVLFWARSSPNGVRKRALLKKGGGSSWTEHMPGNKVKNWSIGQWELM